MQSKSHNARQVAWSALSEGLKLLSSTGLFILVARRLGVDEYGLYAATFALVSSVGPFANLGAGHVMIRAIARGESSTAALAEGMTRVLGGAAVFTLIAFGLRTLYAQEVPPLALFLLCLAELIGTATADMCAIQGFAVGDAKAAASTRMVVTTSRLTAAIVFWILPTHGEMLTTWCSIYLITMIAAGLYSLRQRDRRTKYLIGRLGKIRRRDWLTGIPFSLNLTAAYVQDDIDKVLVLNYLGEGAAGFYAAGYRILNFAYIPLQAALNIVYPRMFRAATEGRGAAWALARRLIIPAFAYGALSCLGLLILGPFVPVALGAGYRGAPSVVIALLWLPAVRALAYIFADYCTTTGMQPARILAQSAGAATNILLNIIWLPQFGWHGAIYASAVSENLTLLALILSALWSRSRSQRA